ncbi:rod shape-determining protein RodA [Aquimarina sp. MMG015]|uniref:rod shape-determining protein RodA n=1 Tax=Aquimarina TaxID=290174 RepID=UPI0004062B49|nr:MULTISPECIES: rod shape-determining protein RodA [Aquimarina]AXT57734.1 rod shape-determining protein RodA [Aquimarina sp. AD1]MBQ4805528.1 rod shape-determining protein RodA [Aquimarina sp. MMG015]RKN07175.1 rod shape-determining protein RodA [Aquimarina sp. AD1]
MARSAVGAIDWLTVLLFLLLIGFGWVNIYSASYGDEVFSITDFTQPYIKQLYWIVLSIVIIVITQAIETKFYERFAGLIYVISLVSLLGLFLFGKNVNGATSWYAFGPVGLQPSEFAKAATALALAKFLSDMQTNINLVNHQLRAFLIITLPALIIIPQPDPGSALVYAAFFFPLYREGLAATYLIIGASAAALFILTLLFTPLWVVLGIATIMLLILIRNRKHKPKYARYLLTIIVITGFCFSVNYIFNNVFEQRHRDRFNIVLGKEVDAKGIGYNTNQSQIAIGSGGWTGKGWKEGTQTKGGFVPEQHTDYIFTTVGEEWGFLGATAVIILFIGLLIRLLYLAERQKSQFSRVYGYSVAGILFIHFVVNVGMVTGLLPTVGIPLPFFSYGGSGLWGFTLLLFIFIKLDSNRVNEW